MKKTKIIIVDDNKSFLTAFGLFISQEMKMSVIATACNSDLFEKLKNVHLADIIFMDLMLPGQNGIEIAIQTLRIHPMLKIVAVTTHSDKAYLENLINAGFKGCLYKNEIFDKAKFAIEDVLKGKYYFPDEIKFNADDNFE